MKASKQLLKELESVSTLDVLQWAMLRLSKELDEEGIVAVDNETGEESLPEVELKFDFTAKISKKKYRALATINYSVINKEDE